MTTLSFTVLDAEFNDGALAQGTEVRSRDNEIKTFLNGGNLDSTNINTAAVFAWTNTQSWSSTSISTNNYQYNINGVLNASVYGFQVYSNAIQINSPIVRVHNDNASSTADTAHIINESSGAGLKISQDTVSAASKYALWVYSNVANTNSPLCYLHQDNASATAGGIEVNNDGTGNAFKATQNGNAIAFEGNQTSSSNSAAVFNATQSGTGDLFTGTLRSLSSLNAVATCKRITTAQTVTGSVTTAETELTSVTTTIPANFLKIGTTITGNLWGRLTSSGTASSIRLRCRLGGISGTVLLDSGAFTPANSLADSLVNIKFTLTCITTGATGTVRAQGVVLWNSNTIPVMRGLGTGATGAANTADITIDTTASNDLVFSLQYGANTAANSTTIELGTLEIAKS